jgi:hypothetical protein
MRATGSIIVVRIAEIDESAWSDVHQGNFRFPPEAVEKRVRDVRRAVSFGHDGVEAL